MASKHPRSPLAPETFPVLPEIPGMGIATAASGMRYKGREDLLLMAFAPGTTVGGVTTASSVPGVPVLWMRDLLPRGQARALLVNAGNANVMTGSEGEAFARRCADAVAAALGCAREEVCLASTGVIGQIPKAEPVEAVVPDLAQKAAGTRDGARWDGNCWERAATAIATTDTFIKGAGATTAIDGRPVRLAGIAKGSGMIAPNMATMLAFIATDAALPANVLQDLVRAANDVSFNCVSVDGDMSTSDMALLFATGQAGNAPPAAASDPALEGFRAALHGLMIDLARQVAADGEGAQKLLTVRVDGATDDGTARSVALTIAESPLVKTAVAGGDANWGRIAMAVGKSGCGVGPDDLVIRIGDQLVAARGGVLPGYDESAATDHFAGRDVQVSVTLGEGPGRAEVWSCDLTHGYIDINADYRS